MQEEARPGARLGERIPVGHQHDEAADREEQIDAGVSEDPEDGEERLRLDVHAVVRELHVQADDQQHG